MTIKRYPLPYLHSPDPAFFALRELGEAVVLDSCCPHSFGGRYDIVTAAPIRQLRLRHCGSLEQREDHGEWQPCSEQDPFTCLQNWLDQHHINPDQSTPFNGGLIGTLAYDLSRHLEQLPQHAVADIQFPHLLMGLYLWAVVTDHTLSESHLVVHPAAKLDVDALLKRLHQSIADPASTPNVHPFELMQPMRSNLSAENYADALSRIHDYIVAGDCYQINFAQRFSAMYRGDPVHLWPALKASAPTPFAACLDHDQGTILSLSPERFLSCSASGAVETRPIKGTRPRGRDAQEDVQLAAELCASDKDRAENLMIVDLLRNDISRVCRPGSVKVPALFALEPYPNVHHLVSVVTGQLEAPHGPLDLLRACFPGGSITGAPKIRAMEIIDELEPHRRSVYCGSIAWISTCGRMDSSITIRTLLCEQQTLYCWAGGGIVADSDIDAEYAETFSKVNNLLKVLEQTRR